ncbi:unnamed protein product [Porites lobata]|uniref:C2 domain-containing protein 2 n=1 Tax=Porites lobata TaxID=104759 RepID=A0ABN8NGL0_9CNID|nr:unnamed protein product [Porites lobata]
MSTQQVVQDLSFPVKVYVGIVHLLLLFLVILFLQRPSKNGDKDAHQGRKSRTITKDDRAVTIESCEWINSTLAWFYLHAQSDENKDRTPLIVKLWLRALNKQLLKEKKKDQRIVIEGLSPGCLPPKLTSVYCLCVSGNMQCITFHVESADLGFLIQVLQETDDRPKSSMLETRVLKLAGEVALKLNTALSRVEVSIQFIGVPEIAMATKCFDKDSEVDGAEVQEKVKEVICKTITTLPLTADTTSKEKLNSDLGSASSKERLNSPSSISCIGEEGKLLVKVIKASGLCGKEKSGTVSPYCVVSTSNPLQRKRTSMVRDNDSPFWNEYFTFDITPKTKEISLDIYDYEKTDRDCNGHVNDSESTQEQDDYLGQVIVPLSTVNRDQTCRLILPVLPKSSKSEHSKGDISLEFTFDKDGKVFDATLPMVSGFERKVSSDAEKPSAQSTPSEESPSILVNGVGSGMVNGHIPLRKRFIESSLDELAMELEAYEQGEQKPKTHDDHVNDTQETEDLHTEPELSPVVIAADEAETSRDTEQMEDESERAIVELLKLSGEDVPEESIEEKRETESETEEKKGEEQTEEQKEDSEKVDEHQMPEEQEEKTEEPSLKPKHRRSFNLFKRRKTDKKVEKDEEKGEEKEETGEETQESDKKEETPAEGTESHEEVHLQNGKEDEEHVTKEEEKVEEESELDRKPKTRRSFNLRFRKRPKSMASADKETEDDGEETGLPRQDPVRHSYHAGDLTALEASKSQDKEEVKESQTEDNKDEEAQEGKQTEDHEAREEEEKLEEASELNRKPKMRHSFNLRFRRRPKSMAAADKETEDDGEEGILSRHDPVRHSYHAGDLPVPDPSNLRRSTSQSSLLSYSPNPYSTLIIETVSKGQKKYSHIPPVMAKRGAYERGGSKLHIYNDHIFQAVHFSGSSPDCAVCGKLIRGKVGKQGYQCRGCKMVTHRDCHYETTAMCTSDAVKHMDM